MTDYPKPFGPEQRYELLKQLGEGAGGRVYLAVDHKEGREVALKQLTRRRTPEEFERRFALLSKLKHENLVELYAMYSTWEPPFYTMQLVPGVDIVRYIREESPSGIEALGMEAEEDLEGNLLLGEKSRAANRSVFTPPESGGMDRARNALRQLCAGLEYAHRQGLIHRDITRGNIRVDSRGRLVVMDYGLAAEQLPTPDAAPASQAPNSDGELVGTAAYMAPEQWNARELSPAVDWYSMGVVLFEALCGALPFVGSAHEVFVRKRTVGAPSPSLLLPQVPDDLDAICKGLMQSDPKRRWNAERVIQRLDRG
ncbi:MAG: serine/threonine protein kinase [Polyangiaceae bacterium]|nr:serine/threonine protein kinase [Myxococcales bacterium]MCB9589342.1 serine/threonine protein kinase [Polyangiaceae bacterium]